MRKAAEVYVVAGNDPVFLLPDCALCFWRKVRIGVPGHRRRFRELFGKLAAAQSAFFLGRPTEQLSDSLPPGRVSCAERWVKSEPIAVPGHEARVVIRGRLDLGLTFEAGDFGLADLKTSRPDPGLPAKYASQLALYTLALERPAEGQFGFGPVTQSGLLVLEPGEMVGADGDYAIRFSPTWMPVPRDDTAAYGLLSEILDLVEDPAPPEASRNCRFCLSRIV